MSDFFANPGTVALWTPLSVEFSRQESWCALPFPSPGDLPDPGMEPGALLRLLRSQLTLYHWVPGESPPVFLPSASPVSVASWNCLLTPSSCPPGTAVLFPLSLVFTLFLVPRGSTDARLQGIHGCTPPALRWRRGGKVQPSWGASAFPTPRPLSAYIFLLSESLLWDMHCVTCFIFTLSLNLCNYCQVGFYYYRTS